MRSLGRGRVAPIYPSKEPKNPHKILKKPTPNPLEMKFSGNAAYKNAPPQKLSHSDKHESYLIRTNMRVISFGQT